MNFQVQNPQRQRPRIEMLPMIDVVLFLLIFFMLFTTFKTNETGLEVDLPRAATGSRQLAANLVVTITESGAIYLDGKLTTLDNFSQAATRSVAENPDASITIRGDSRSYWEHAVGVMDAARKAGIYNFAFGTQPENP